MKRKLQTLKSNCLMFKARNNELWKKSKDLQIAMQIFKDISTNSLPICRYTENSSDVCTIRFYIPRWKWRKCNSTMTTRSQKKTICKNSMRKWTESSQKKFRRKSKIQKNSSDSCWKTTQSDMLWAESIEHFLQSVSSRIWFCFIS